MHTGKQKQMNAAYQASLVNRHIRRFTGFEGVCVIHLLEYPLKKRNKFILGLVAQ